MDIYDLMKQVNDAFNQRYCFSSKRKNSKRYGFTILGQHRTNAAIRIIQQVPNKNCG